MKVPEFKIRWKTKKRAKKILKLMAEIWPEIYISRHGGDSSVCIANGYIYTTDKNCHPPTITLRDLKAMAKIAKHGREERYWLPVNDRDTDKSASIYFSGIGNSLYYSDRCAEWPHSHFWFGYEWNGYIFSPEMEKPDTHTEITLPALRLMADYLRPQEEPVNDADAELNGLRERVKELEAENEAIGREKEKQEQISLDLFSEAKRLKKELKASEKSVKQKTTLLESALETKMALEAKNKSLGVRIAELEGTVKTHNETIGERLKGLGVSATEIVEGAENLSKPRLTFDEFAEAYRRAESKYEAGTTITQEVAIQNIYDELTRQPEPDTVPVPEEVKFVEFFGDDEPCLLISETQGLYWDKSHNGWGVSPNSKGDHVDTIPMVIETTSVKFSDLKLGEWWIHETDKEFADKLNIYTLKVSEDIGMWVDDGDVSKSQMGASERVYRVRPV